jgi:hypothetical protein
VSVTPEPETKAFDRKTEEAQLLDSFDILTERALLKVAVLLLLDIRDALA